MADLGFFFFFKKRWICFHIFILVAALTLNFLPPIFYFYSKASPTLLEISPPVKRLYLSERNQDCSDNSIVCIKKNFPFKIFIKSADLRNTLSNPYLCLVWIAQLLNHHWSFAILSINCYWFKTSPYWQKCIVCFRERGFSKVKKNK